MIIALDLIYFSTLIVFCDRKLPIFFQRPGMYPSVIESAFSEILPFFAISFGVSYLITPEGYNTFNIYINADTVYHIISIQ